MKKNYFTYHALGLGANQIGIEYGCSTFLNAHMEWHSKFDTLETQHVLEDFDTEFTQLKYLHSVIRNCKSVAMHTANIVPNHRSVLIGGDHSLALGSIKGALSCYPDLGVIWIDAHGDMNTHESTLSGHIHGMPLAALCGLGDVRLCNLFSEQRLNSKHVVLFATRDIDEKEEDIINALGIKNITMAEIDQRGFDVCFKEACAYLLATTDKLHISLDLDSIDPQLIPGVTTDVANGISTDQVLDMFDTLNTLFDVTSIDIVEFNPTRDIDNKTVDFMNELLCKIDTYTAN